jgi:hypothetical protein
MSMQGVIGIFSLIVILAIITTIVSRKNSATIIDRVGDLFTKSLFVAMGSTKLAA